MFYCIVNIWKTKTLWEIFADNEAGNDLKIYRWHHLDLELKKLNVIFFSDFIFIFYFNWAPCDWPTAMFVWGYCKQSRVLEVWIFGNLSKCVFFVVFFFLFLISNYEMKNTYRNMRNNATPWKVINLWNIDD